MKTLNYLLVIVGLIILTITNPLIARFDSWDSEDGVMIRQGYHVYWTGEAMISDGNDRWMISWADARNGTQDVYAQLFDADGNELWTPGGMVVANCPWPEEMPMLVYAGNDEWIIGWQDYRHDLDYHGRAVVFAQKYNSQGEALWMEGGVFIGPESGNDKESKFQTQPVMHPTTDGGAICVFEDDENNHGSMFFAQRLSSDGELLWGEEGVTLFEGMYNFSSCSDGNDGLFFLRSSAGQVCEHDLTIHRVNSDGEHCWGEDMDGLPLDNPDGHSYRGKIVPVGNGGLIATWIHNLRFNIQSIYGQHIDSDGEFFWGEYGSELNEPTEDYINYAMIKGSENEIEIIWRGNNTPMYAQKIESVDQQPVLHWGEEDEEKSGLLISDESPYLKTLNPDGRGGLIATWIEYPENGYRDFKVQRINAEGEIPWDETKTIRVKGLDCSSQNVIALNDEIFFAWRETSPPVSGINFQAYDLDDGAAQFEEYSVPIISGLRAWTENPRIIRSGESAYVSWVDTRYYPYGSVPYMQRVDIVSGQPQWENQGINITPTYLENSDSSNTRIYGPISIVPDGSGGAIAMWRMKTMGAQRMNEDGSLEWGENGISIFGQNFDFNTSRNHQLYSDNEGGAVVIAELGRSNDLGNQIKIQHLDSNGQTLHGETGILIQEIDNDRYSLRMRSTQLSDGNFLISWMRNFNLEAIKVNMDGENLWNSTVALHEFGERYSSYKVAEIENTITITYEDIEGETYQTYIMYLNQEGEKVQNQNDLRINNFDDNYQLVNLFSDGNSGWMTYLTGSELYLTSLNIEGDEPQLDADRAQLITNTASERVNVSIVADGVGGVFVFWGERGNGSDIHYKHFNNNIQPVCKEYQNGGVVLVDARYSQSQMCIVPDGEGGVLTAWNDWRASTGKQEGDDVYIMRVGDGYSLSSDDYAANVTLPDRWSLDAAYPNPFNSTTKISFKTPVKASIKVAVFDVMGREIARLAQGDHAAGKYSLIWDSRNSSGQSVVSGMYFYKLEGEGVQLTKKMFLIK